MILPGLRADGVKVPSMLVAGTSAPRPPVEPYPAGSGGKFFWPSYHIISTGGMSPRGPNLKRRVVSCGKKKSFAPVSFSGSISYGRPSSRNWWHVSIRCAAQSPMAPMPKSNQPRQLPGWYFPL